jgi:hypothetical protein
MGVFVTHKHLNVLGICVSALTLVVSLSLNDAIKVSFKLGAYSIQGEPPPSECTKVSVAACWIYFFSITGIVAIVFVIIDRALRPKSTLTR